MSKKIKGMMERELGSVFDGVSEMVLVSLRGVSGNENNQFRGELLGKQIHVKVVKNSLAARTFEQLGMPDIKQLLTGPCAIVYGGDSVIDVAKELVEWDKKLDNFEIKGGYLEGQLLDAHGARDLAKMLTRTEQQGAVVALAMSPGGSVAGAVGAPAATIAGCVKALIEKLEEAA
jgi:large subunit ribosomal protein L10